MSTQKIHLHITGMSCGHCQQNVSRAIQGVKGVKKAEVTLDPPDAYVEYEDGETNKVAIIAAVNKTKVYTAS